MEEVAPKEAREAFYAAALVGLKALDGRERTPRRFGPDADARWQQFRGALGDADRLDLLLRDGAVTWGPAFSPADSFGFFGLTHDEPFGPDWQGISNDRAATLAGHVGAASLSSAAAALKIEAQPVVLPALTASTRVVVAGGAAILAVAERFATAPELSWSDQVVVVASSPAFRQLAGLAAVLLAAKARTPLVRPDAEPAPVLASAGFPAVDAAVVSPDAEPACADFARKAAG